MAVSAYNSVAFRINYLLGIDKEFLDKNFSEEFIKSSKLKYFENYVDAKKLRSLCRVRQSVLLEYSSYIKKIKKSLTFPAKIKEDVDYLKKEGIDLVKGLEELEIHEFFNYLSAMIEVIRYKVLLDLEIPYIEALENYFYFPEVSESDMTSLVAVASENSGYYGIYIFESEYIKQSLKYALMKDKNLIYSIYSIMNKSCDLDIPYYNYEYRKSKGEDLDSSRVIDSMAILDNIIKNRNGVESVEEISSVEEVEIPIITESSSNEPIESLVNVPVISKETIEIDTTAPYRKTNITTSDMYKYMQVDDVEIYVDCDNVEFFKFITFMNTISHFNTIKNIVLIVDEKANFLWKVFDKFYTGKVNIKTIFVPRLKDHKSVADIVLTKEICQSVYTRNQNRVVLVSSDSDFFGLISVLSDVSFGVAYVEKAISQEYLNYLGNLDIPTIDLMTLDTKDTIQKYTNTAFAYYMLNVLSYLPMYAWTVAKVTEHVFEAFTSETDKEIDMRNIKSFIASNFDNVSMEIKDEKVVLKLNDVSIEV